MPTIHVTTEIEAPPERCFDLARDVEVHYRTAAFSREKAVGGTTTGLLCLGDTVTFEGVHFGIRQRLTAKIVEFEPPHRFVDEMVSGVFRSLHHVHTFETCGEATLMRDTITWVSPWGLLGKLADLFVVPHMRSFLQRRNRALRRVAEAQNGSPLASSHD